MEKISIIMPVSNAALYLKSCIEAVLNQDFQDFKLILINDGSTDKSASICNLYAEKDSRISVYHQMSQGIGAARNKGLQLARGEYILFIEHNNCIAPNLLSEIYHMAETEKADWIIWSLRKMLYDKRSRLVDSDEVQATGIKCKTASECRGKFTEMIKWESLLLETTWNKLYKRELIETNGLRFGTIRGQQNIVFNLEYFQCTRSLIATPKVYSDLHILEEDYEYKILEEYYESTYFIHHCYRQVLNEWRSKRVELELVDYHFLTDIIGIIKYCMKPGMNIGFIGRYIYIRKLMKKLEVKEAAQYVTEQKQYKGFTERFTRWKFNCIKKQKVLPMIIVYYIENIFTPKRGYDKGQKISEV